jgi:hypothetical protein
MRSRGRGDCRAPIALVTRFLHSIRRGCSSRLRSPLQPGTIVALWDGDRDCGEGGP